MQKSFKAGSYAPQRASDWLVGQLADFLETWGVSSSAEEGDLLWLTTRQPLYWGDLDVHGFQILAQLRAHYPAAQSLLMDGATFGRYYGGGRGGSFVSRELPSLTPAEQALYQELLRTNARLEQEQLPARYVAAAVPAAGREPGVA